MRADCYGMQPLLGPHLSSFLPTFLPLAPRTYTLKCLSIIPQTIIRNEKVNFPDPLFKMVGRSERCPAGWFLGSARNLCGRGYDQSSDA